VRFWRHLSNCFWGYCHHSVFIGVRWVDLSLTLDWRLCSRECGNAARCAFCVYRCCSVVVAPLNCERQWRVQPAARSPPAPPVAWPTTVIRTQPKPTTRRSSRRCCLPGHSSSSGCRTWYFSYCLHTSTQNSQLIACVKCAAFCSFWWCFAVSEWVVLRLTRHFGDEVMF